MSPRPSLADLVAPSHTAVVTQECQRGIIGSAAVLPALAEIAELRMIPATARLVRTARGRGVQVVHCVATHRDDHRGSNTNTRLSNAVRRSPVKLIPGSEAAMVIAEIGVVPDDLVLSRLHGLSPMSGTDLDMVLRNLGVTTIVGVGVSINVGMTNFVMDAVNAGYDFVLPRDGVAGVPESYADAVIDNTLSLLATITSVDDVVAAWTDR